MIELGLACYAIHFAAYQKFGLRPGHVGRGFLRRPLRYLIEHWRCTFCFTFWPASAVSIATHGLGTQAATDTLAACVVAMLVSQASDLMDR